MLHLLVSHIDGLRIGGPVLDGLRIGLALLGLRIG
jgi:hypothetical protein